MRPFGRFTFGAAVGLLFFCGTPCRAQQGSLQVSAAVQGTTGAPERVAGQPAIDPDFGVSWLQPGSRFGVFQIELRGARRGDSLHTGRMYGALRDLKYRNAIWTIEAGDAHFSPGLGDDRLANLFTPVVTFNGASLSGRSAAQFAGRARRQDDGVAQHFRQRPAGARTIARSRPSHPPANRAARSQHQGVARSHIVAARVQLRG